MKNFAKLFESDRGQLLALRCANENDAPCIRIMAEPENFGLCEVAINFSDTDAGYASAQKALDSMSVEAALKALQPLFELTDIASAEVQAENETSQPPFNNEPPSNIHQAQVVTIAIKVPAGMELALGSTINVQGHEVSCQTINWGTNSCMQASALEQRLEAALGVLDDAGGNYLDDYIDRLNELSDEGDLEELVNTTVNLYGTF